MANEVIIRLICSCCGNIVKGTLAMENNVAVTKVFPCKKCLDQANIDGFDEAMNLISAQDRE